MKSLLLTVLVALLLPMGAGATPCVDCHLQTTPNTVADWQLSMHSRNDVSCDVG